MKKLWILINELRIKKNRKIHVYLGMSVLYYAMIGGLIWLVFGRFYLPEIDWFVCFMGYPAVFGGFFGGVLYLYNHEFGS